MAHPTTHPAAKATPPPVLRLALLSPEEMPAEWRDPARWWQTAYTLMSVLDHDATRMAIEADNEDSPLATLFFSTALGDFAHHINEARRALSEAFSPAVVDPILAPEFARLTSEPARPVKPRRPSSRPSARAAKSRA